MPRPSAKKAVKQEVEFAYERPYLYPKQLDALFCDERYSIVEASSKAGKTSGCLVWILEQALKGKSGNNYWWVAPIFEQAKIAYKRLKRDLPEDMCQFNDTNQTVTFPHGTVITFKGSDRPDCYDDLTEILTRNGWKLFADLSKDDEVLALNFDSMSSKWEKPTRIIHEPYSGDMVHILNKRTDLLVTPDHRIPLVSQKGRKHIEKASFLAGKRHLGHAMPMCGSSWYCPDNDSISDDDCAFMGIYISEGSSAGTKGGTSAIKNGDYSVFISQTPGVKGGSKGDVYCDIMDLLSRSPYRFFPVKGSFQCRSKELWEKMRILGHASQKYIPEEYKNLPARKLYILLDWLIKGDGSIKDTKLGKNSSRVYYTTSKRLADDVQEIVIKLGWNATIRTMKPCSPFIKGKKINVLLPVYSVSIHYNKNTYLSCSDRSYVSVEPYVGSVHCVSVPSSIVMVRRNGKPAWSGNSLYGEDVYAAVIDEGSRVRHDAWIAVRSTITATGGPVRIIGNVHGKANWMYALAREVEAEQEKLAKGSLEPRLGSGGNVLPRKFIDYKYSRLTALDAVDAEIFDNKELEDARSSLPPDVFNELYMAIPSDSEGNPFGDAIGRCSKDKGEPIVKLSNRKPLCFGVDCAKSNDWTVVVGIDQWGYVCVFDRFKGGETRDLTQRVADNVQRFPALVDSTPGSIGNTMLEELQRQSSSQYEGFPFTKTSKQELMQNLRIMLHNERLHFPDSGALIDELYTFEYKYTANGVLYSAPDGYKDDSVMALALAAWKWKELAPAHPSETQSGHAVRVSVDKSESYTSTASYGTCGRGQSVARTREYRSY